MPCLSQSGRSIDTTAADCTLPDEATVRFRTNETAGERARREVCDKTLTTVWNDYSAGRLVLVVETSMNNQAPSFSSSLASDSLKSNNQSSGPKSQDVRGTVGEAVSKLADVAQQAGSQAKQTASSLASDANQKAKGFLNQRVASGADLAGHVADSARCAADNLDQNAPQLADLVRGAAKRVEEFSRDLRGHEDLVRTASDFTRRQPAVVFGFASLAGFLLFRVLKSNPPRSSEDGYLRGDNYRSADRFGGASRQFDGA
jgi:ElaB/YqjD/DUF883 family membrane-anchored ribosome-binding protein